MNYWASGYSRTSTLPGVAVVPIPHTSPQAADLSPARVLHEHFSCNHETQPSGFATNHHGYSTAACQGVTVSASTESHTLRSIEPQTVQRSLRSPLCRAAMMRNGRKRAASEYVAFLALTHLAEGSISRSLGCFHRDSVRTGEGLFLTPTSQAESSSSINTALKFSLVESCGIRV